MLFCEGLMAFNREFQEKTLEFVWEGQGFFDFFEQNLYKLKNKFCFNFFASIIKIKTIKIDFCFNLKALFVLKIIKFLYGLSRSCRKTT